MAEIIDSRELARRLTLPESWIRDNVRGRATDPIPHLRLGRYVRFEWGSSDLEGWLARHRVSNGNGWGESKRRT